MHAYSRLFKRNQIKKNKINKFQSLHIDMHLFYCIIILFTYTYRRVRNTNYGYDNKNINNFTAIYRIINTNFKTIHIFE